jgi:hypothetical protein
MQWLSILMKISISKYEEQSSQSLAVVKRRPSSNITVPSSRHTCLVMITPLRQVLSQLSFFVHNTPCIRSACIVSRKSLGPIHELKQAALVRAGDISHMPRCRLLRESSEPPTSTVFYQLCPHCYLESLHLPLRQQAAFPPTTM